MKKIIVCLLSFSLLTACAEKTSIAPQSTSSESMAAIRAPRTVPGIDGEIFSTVENNPEFPGGVSEMYRYIGENIKYPEAARKNKTMGKVFVRFVVDTEGKIKNVTTLKGIGSGCDEEAARVLAEMPTWTPGKQDGKPVNVYFTMPIAFKLQ